MKFIFSLSCFLMLIGTTSAYSQNAMQQCETNIELLKRDLISMLNKTPAMPPIAQVYTAAKSRYDQLQMMRNRGDYTSCAIESERVLRITRPYGNR